MSNHYELEFPLTEDIIYLNHAAVAPWPRRTAQAVQQFAEENMRLGAKNYSRWQAQVTRLRQQCQQLINAPSADDIALLKNTSEALSVVAYGLNWQVGDNIVISDQEFPSNRIVWQSLSNQGVQVRQVNLSPDPEAALLAAVDEGTRLIAISSVQYASGLRMDLAKIGEFCRQHQILFCVDAIQSLGALRFDVQAIHADFVMADAHKWLLGPEGIALFYCAAERRAQLQLKQFGWHMVEHCHDFDNPLWTVATSARRFECGSPNMLGIHALSASLSLFETVGMATVEQGILANSHYLIDGLSQNAALELLSPKSPDRYAGIVSFRHRHSATAALFEYLQDNGIICAQRGGGIRFSPHFYTQPAQLQTAIERVEAYRPR